MSLIVLWTSGLNKIHIVHLIFRISYYSNDFKLFLLLLSLRNIKYSRSLLKNSQLQFIPSLLKEKDLTIRERLTIFVEEKNERSFKNIFIEDEVKI